MARKTTPLPAPSKQSRLGRITQAVSLRLKGMSLADIAQQMGVQPPTVGDYLTCPEGRALLVQVRADLLAQVRADLQQDLREAGKTLRSLLREDNPQVRFRASLALLRLAGVDRPAFPVLKFTTAGDIRASLEAAVQAVAQGEMDPEALVSLANLSARLLETEELEQRLAEMAQRIRKLEADRGQPAD